MGTRERALTRRTEKGERLKPEITLIQRKKRGRYLEAQPNFKDYREIAPTQKELMCKTSISLDGLIEDQSLTLKRKKKKAISLERFQQRALKKSVRDA